MTMLKEVLNGASSITDLNKFLQNSFDFTVNWHGIKVLSLRDHEGDLTLHDLTQKLINCFFTKNEENTYSFKFKGDSKEAFTPFIKMANQIKNLEGSFCDRRNELIKDIAAIINWIAHLIFGTKKPDQLNDTMALDKIMIKLAEKDGMAVAEHALLFFYNRDIVKAVLEENILAIKKIKHLSSEKYSLAHEAILLGLKTKGITIEDLPDRLICYSLTFTKALAQFDGSKTIKALFKKNSRLIYDEEVVYKALEQNIQALKTYKKYLSYNKDTDQEKRATLALTKCKQLILDGLHSNKITLDDLPKFIKF